MTESTDPPGPASYPTPPRIDGPEAADPREYSGQPQFVPDFRSPYPAPPRPQQPYYAPQFPPPASQVTNRQPGLRIGRVLIAVGLLALVVGGGAGYFGARLGGSQTATGSPSTASSAPVVVTTPASVPRRHISAIPPARGADTVAVAQRLLPSTVTIQVTAGSQGELGSGFVLDYHGRIMTNNHVIADAAGGTGSITVTFSDGHRSRAEILGRSPSYDIAVIQVADHNDLRPVALGDSSQTRVGEAAVAIGSPLGLGGSVTEGIVSAVNRPVAVGDANSADGQAYLNAVQTDAPINHGNSGGPLVDGSGDVIGVNSAILTGSSDQENSGNIGIGFAIPINQARQIGELLIKTGHASYPVINATVTSNGSGDGVVLNTVEPGGAADRAGLRTDDVVTAINGRPVGEAEDLIVAIRNHRPGDLVTLKFERHGRTHSVEVKLGSKRG